MLGTAGLGELATQSQINACLGDSRWEATARFCRVAARVLHSPDTDLPEAAGVNFSSNIPLEPGGTGYVESLVGLQAEIAGDDFFLDLGGVAEDRLAARSPAHPQPG
jgi:hypothetical protein